MSRQSSFLLACLILLVSVLAVGQNPPASDPQALAYAAQSIAAMTGGTTINDVTLTGTVTWNGTDTGTATVQALGTGESRIDLALAAGSRTEIRDAQSGMPQGQWINPNNSSGYFSPQNCWTDAVWFFPALSSLSAGQNVVLTYIGQETRNDATVQHIQSYLYQSGQFPSPTPSQLSTMDFYLDAGTLLPVALTFNVHPDNDATTNLSIEVDFTNYQIFNGVPVPTRIQQYQQGSLMIDITVSQASFNTGIPLSVFTIN